MHVSEATPIPVRLKPETIARLDAIAERLGTTRTGVIKICLKSFLDHFETSGASLEINWDTALADMDGRTRQGRALDQGAHSRKTGKLPASSGPGAHGKSVYPRKGKKQGRSDPEISAEDQALADEVARRALREQVAKLRGQQKSAATNGKTS